MWFAIEKVCDSYYHWEPGIRWVTRRYSCTDFTIICRFCLFQTTRIYSLFVRLTLAMLEHWKRWNRNISNYWNIWRISVRNHILFRFCGWLCSLNKLVLLTDGLFYSFDLMLGNNISQLWKDSASTYSMRHNAGNFLICLMDLDLTQLRNNVTEIRWFRLLTRMIYCSRVYTIFR